MKQRTWSEFERYGTEFAQAVREQNYDFANCYFCPTDALSYYALLRERKTYAVIEIRPLDVDAGSRGGTTKKRSGDRQRPNNVEHRPVFATLRRKKKASIVRLP